MAELSTATKDPLIAAFFTLEMQGAVQGVFKSLENVGSENELTEYKASGPKGEQVVKYQPGFAPTPDPCLAVTASTATT